MAIRGPPLSNRPCASSPGSLRSSPSHLFHS
jgi:hypothetical protein